MASFWPRLAKAGQDSMASKKAALQVETYPAVLTVKAAARLAGVCRETVREWCSKELVVSYHPFDGRGSARKLICTKSLCAHLGIEVEMRS